MRTSRRAISNAAVAIIIVVIFLIAVAAAVGTMMTGRPLYTTNSLPTSASVVSGTTSSSPTTSSSTTTNIVNNTAVTGTTSLCTTPGTNLTNSILPPTGAGNNTITPSQGLLTADLLNNFSQMSLSFDITNLGGGSSNGTTSATIMSYSAQNATINGTTYHVVNYKQNATSSSSTPNVSSNTSAILYINSAGNATIVRSESSNYTGALAQAQGSVIMLPFMSVFYGATLFLENAPAGGLTPVNQSTITINGNIQMNVTNYKFTPQFCTSQSSTTSGTNSSGAIYLQIGKVPSTHRELITYLKESTSSAQFGTAVVTVALLSVTPTAQATNTTTTTIASKRT